MGKGGKRRNLKISLNKVTNILERKRKAPFICPMWPLWAAMRQDPESAEFVFCCCQVSDFGVNSNVGIVRDHLLIVDARKTDSGAIM